MNNQNIVEAGKSNDKKGDSKCIKLLGKEIKIQEGVWIKANKVRIEKDESMTLGNSVDGFITIPASEHTSFSENDSGWYRYYESNKIRNA